MMCFKTAIAALLATMSMFAVMPAHAEMAEGLMLEGLPWEQSAAFPGAAVSTHEGELAGRRVRTIDSEEVKTVLAAHPEHDLIICIAGCKNGREGHASIIAQRHHAERFKFAALMNGGLAGLRSLATGQDATPGGNSETVDGEQEEIICLAGCNGPVGMIVFRGMRMLWISKERSKDLKDALRSLAERLAAAEAHKEQGGRQWLGVEASHQLMNALGGQPEWARRMTAALERMRTPESVER